MREIKIFTDEYFILANCESEGEDYYPSIEIKEVIISCLDLDIDITKQVVENKRLHEKIEGIVQEEYKRKYRD